MMAKCAAVFLASIFATSLSAATPNQQAGMKPVGPQAQVQPQAALPFPQAMILIRSSLIALQQADETGSYATLQALGTQDFQANNPAQKLAQTFAALRPYNISSVLVLEPKFTRLPQIQPDKSLVMAGFFVSDGYHITFQLGYMPENGRWKLSAINAGIQSAKTGPISR